MLERILQKLLNPIFWLGAVLGVIAGLIWGFFIYYGPDWSSPFHTWQSISAGLLAFAAAIIAYLAVRQQIRSSEKLAENEREHQRKRELARTLADLGAEALQMYHLHTSMLSNPKTYDEQELSNNFYSLLMYPTLLDGLIDFDDQFNLQGYINDYGNAQFSGAQRVTIINGTRSLSIVNIEIPNAIATWARHKMRTVGCTITGTLERHPTAEWSGEAETSTTE